jgi:hypothetical protein
MAVLDDLEGWTAAMTLELTARRFRPTGEPRDLGLNSIGFNNTR